MKHQINILGGCENLMRVYEIAKRGGHSVCLITTQDENGGPDQRQLDEIKMRLAFSSGYQNAQILF